MQINQYILGLVAELFIFFIYLFSLDIIDRNSRIIKYIYMILGIFSVILGIIGAVLPIIPTTPFLLVASFFFTRSSRKLNQILHSNRYLGPYLTSISTGNGMPVVAKVYTISLLWFLVGISIFMIDIISIKITLFLIATFVSVYILGLKTSRLK